MCGTSLAQSPTVAAPAAEPVRPTSLAPQVSVPRPNALSGAPVHSVGPSPAAAASAASSPPAQYGRDGDWQLTGQTMDSSPPRAPEAPRVPRPGQEPTTQALRAVNGGGYPLAVVARSNPSEQRSSAEQRCWRCGSMSGQSAAFCQACGASLREGGAPAPAVGVPAPNARLIVIAQDGSAGQEYPIQGGQIDIGRESGEVRIAADGYACPRHARLSWRNGSFWVTDLGSVNGVFVRLANPERLQHGDIVLLGMGVLRFEVVTANEMALAPAIERGTRLFGSPATPRYARLVERTVEGLARNVLYLSKNVVTIGRETGDIVFTDDPFMSRQHAGLERQSDGSFMLKDLGSSNGTFVAIRGERALPDGSHIRIGQHLFRLKVDGL